ncbi:MAG: hypothetical protein JSR17_02545 [Proteobacteria bacterium]|nr:hypothetical protein [Pseudomonadota bacterium]
MMLFSQSAATAASAAKPASTTPAVESAFPNIAISSGYMNNCGFHSIIHLWMALPDEMFSYLYNNFPVFKEIHREFCNQYGGEVSLEKLLQFKKLPLLDNPWDRELIWGGVFREVLKTIAALEVVRISELPPMEDADIESVQYRFGPKELEFLETAECVDFRMLKLLTEKMGLDLTVYNQVASHAEFELPIYHFAPERETCWQAELFFNGGHYDFTHQDKALNKAHNDKRAVQHSCLLMSAPRVAKEGQALTPEFIRNVVVDIVRAVNQKLTAPEQKSTLKPNF